MADVDSSRAEADEAVCFGSLIAVRGGSDVEVQPGPSDPWVRPAGLPVVIRRAEYPETDITTLNGVRCTTALRTIIDVAVDLSRQDLHLLFSDALDRGLFTLEDARRRLAEPDMADHRSPSSVAPRAGRKAVLP